MSINDPRDKDLPLGEHWRRNRPRTEGEQDRSDRLRTSPPAQDRRRDEARAREVDRRREDESRRRDSTAAVDLYAIDTMYARSAANGMADNKGKNLAVETAVTDAAQQRAGAPGRAAPPTRRDRARAAQRWEQNREYVESRHEGIDRKQ